MRGVIKSCLKGALLTVVNVVTRRHTVLLPAEARCDVSLLDLRAPYRADGEMLTLELREPGPGRLTAKLLAYDGYFPTKVIWAGSAQFYTGPSPLKLDLATGSVIFAGREWGHVPVPLPGRRFCWHVTLMGADGVRRVRLTGHYVPGDGCTVGSDYFRGSNYVDHETQSVDDHREILELLRRHHAEGPVLEVGCATGGLLAALEMAGFTSVGIDSSQWAVARASERLGPNRAWVCDVEQDPLHAEVNARSPFRTVVLASVLEHFRDPFAVLGKLAAVIAPGAILVLTTTNADSLTHALFGPQWEGYFDWTHFSVDRVGVKSLREELPRLGWRIAELTTHAIWDGDADPTSATLREWWAADARFRRLLVERDLGDFITCVAVKE